MESVVAAKSIFFARVRVQTAPGQFRPRPFVFYCEAIKATPDGVFSRCLNMGFDCIVKHDGTFKLPRTGETAHVEMIVDAEKLKFPKHEYSAAINYFHRRMAAK